MALKKKFTDEEIVGLTQEEIKLGLKYLRKHKTAGAVPDVEALKLYEMYLIGCTFTEISKQYPQYELGQIILTAAIRKWGMDRDRMQCTLKDRVQAKVVKSVIEQVDFLTSMLSVSSAEHIEAMRNYIINPDKYPKPDMRIASIKEYKDVTETLYKIVSGATSNSKSSPMFGALGSKQPQQKKIEEKKKDYDIDLDDIEIDSDK